MAARAIHRLIWRETLLALLVAALTFLNFGHDSAVFAAGGRVVVTGHSICGDQPATNDGDHFACHACRQDLPTLPPPPALVAPVVFASTPVAYAELAISAASLPSRINGRPRALPSA